MPKFSYKIGAFFGISYNYKLAETIEEELSKEARFKQIFGDENAELITEDGRIIETSNSDDDSASRVMIVCSNLTFYGGKKKDAEDTYIALDPNYLITEMGKYPKTIATLSDMFAMLKASKKIKASDITLGWMFTPCYIQE